MTKRLLTPEQARMRITRSGISVTALARDLGIHPQTIWEVLSGRNKGVRGDAHVAAVALGMKDGVIVADGAPIADALKRAS